MAIREKHRQDADKVQDEMLEWISSNNKSKISISPQKNTSNTVRANNYHHSGPKLSIGELNKVIEIDKERKTAVVQPRVTMEQLADATLAHGLIPAVLPEFKSITVGGAINGTALESSSHKYGQFNDICSAYEILLGDGAIIRATPHENADIFYGISGAYGSLGIILSVEIQLIPTEKNILLEYHRFDTIDSAVGFMRNLVKSNEPPEFIEGVVLESNCTMVITGEPSKEEGAPKLDLGSYYSKWYYQVINERAKDGISRQLISTRDYLFRHDRAGFWMGGYALHPKLLMRYFLECIGWCPKWLNRWLMSERSNKHYNVRFPGSIFRFLLGWVMKSERLYRIMHTGTEKWFADNFSIQDYYIPEQKTADFSEYVIRQYGITPIWLCPMKATQTPQFLSPHYSEVCENKLFFDVGVYGFAKDNQKGDSVVYDLDKLTVSLGGKKMLYSYSYYTIEEFWKIYPKEKYQKLRQKYFASNSFLDITDKVL